MNTKQIIFKILTGLFLISASITCLIEYVITKNFSWSLIVLSSIIYGYLLLIPILLTKNKTLIKTLGMFSITIIPYLYVLSIILNIPVLYNFGASIAVMTVVFIWIIYFIFKNLFKRKFIGIGLTLLLTIPFVLILNYTVSIFFKEAIFNIISNAISSVSLFVLAILSFTKETLRKK